MRWKSLESLSRIVSRGERGRRGLLGPGVCSTHGSVQERVCRRFFGGLFGTIEESGAKVYLYYKGLFKNYVDKILAFFLTTYPLR